MLQTGIAVWPSRFFNNNINDNNDMMMIIIIIIEAAELEGRYFSMFPTNPSVLLSLQSFSGDINTFECN